MLAVRKSTAPLNVTGPPWVVTSPDSDVGPVTDNAPVTVEIGLLTFTDVPALSAKGPAPVLVIEALIRIWLFAISVKPLFDDHDTGAETVMAPASSPGLPAKPVETTTFALVS